MIEHIPYNPKINPGVPIERIPKGFILDKVVPVTEYEWIMVCHKVEDTPDERT